MDCSRRRPRCGSSPRWMGEHRRRRLQRVGRATRGQPGRFSYRLPERRLVLRARRMHHGRHLDGGRLAARDDLRRNRGRALERVPVGRAGDTRPAGRHLEQPHRSVVPVPHPVHRRRVRGDVLRRHPPIRRVLGGRGLDPSACAGATSSGPELPVHCFVRIDQLLPGGGLRRERRRDGQGARRGVERHALGDRGGAGNGRPRVALRRVVPSGIRLHRRRRRQLRCPTCGEVGRFAVVTSEPRPSPRSEERHVERRLVLLSLTLRDRGVHRQQGGGLRHPLGDLERGDVDHRTGADAGGSHPGRPGHAVAAPRTRASPSGTSTEPGSSPMSSPRAGTARPGRFCRVRARAP